MPALSTDVLFDYMAVRLNPVKAEGSTWCIDWQFSDTGEYVALNLENATLTHRLGEPSRVADTIVRLNRSELNQIMTDATTFEALLSTGRARVEGDSAKVAMLFGMLDEFQPMFNIVTP